MKVRNIFESFLYSIGSFIKYTILFAIIYSLLFGVSELKNAIYNWCIPLTVGSFLGYLGGKEFIWLVEIKKVILLLFAIIIINFFIAFWVRNILFSEEQWWLTAIMLILPISWGFINSIPNGLNQRMEENE